MCLFVCFRERFFDPERPHHPWSRRKSLLSGAFLAHFKGKRVFLRDNGSGRFKFGFFVANRRRATAETRHFHRALATLYINIHERHRAIWNFLFEFFLNFTGVSSANVRWNLCVRLSTYTRADNCFLRVGPFTLISNRSRWVLRRVITCFDHGCASYTRESFSR